MIRQIHMKHKLTFKTPFDIRVYITFNIIIIVISSFLLYPSEPPYYTGEVKISSIRG